MFENIELKTYKNENEKHVIQVQIMKHFPLHPE